MKIEIRPRFSRWRREEEKGKRKVLMNLWEMRFDAGEALKARVGAHKLAFLFSSFFIIIKKFLKAQRSCFKLLEFHVFRNTLRCHTIHLQTHKFSLVTFLFSLSAKCCAVVHYVMWILPFFLFLA